ncbi:glutactin-like [Contarinia nasturtii]|uniref:glutactin-like n=1 Tax=Contarinia nasturtii TaxID=265458 RepID=UPI0012D4979C|nr:glutactin-like [Contarinia nasturtii]XP_031618956.1 glutactin-like [Contarinia nasturtii]
MWCLKTILFICILCAEYLWGEIDSNTLKVLIERVQNLDVNDIESDNIERNHNALKRQAIVNLPKYGMIQGSIGFSAWTERTIFQFLNVRYAESPSGAKRFKAPVPIKPWQGIHNAESYGTKCPTLEDLDKMTYSQREKIDLEDCLNMAVYTTNLNASLPVMVYIHGGSFYLHNADEYPPQYLMEKDIVLIVVQYRLDALGFLSTNSKEIPGNAGLMDSIQALKFIKENVQYFGGNPDKITIFGQSSGAAMVSALVICPSVPENLFDKAIIQSGSIFGNWAYTLDPLTDAKNIAQVAGLNPNQSITSLNRAFMTMNVYDLLKAVDKYQTIDLINGGILSGGRSLSIGGPNKLLPDTPQNLALTYNKSIPIIVGATKDDGAYGATVVYDILAATNKLDDNDFMTNDLVKALCKMARLNDDSGTVEALISLTYWSKEQISSGDFGVCAAGIIDMLGMTMLKAPILKLAQINARISPHQTYVYSFDYAGEHTRFGYEADVSHYPFTGGVSHSDDLIYLFPYPPNVAKLNEKDTKFAQQLIELWTSFATNGVPELTDDMDDGIKELMWQPFIGPFGAYLHINNDFKLATDYRDEFTVETRNHKNNNQTKLFI